MHLSSQKIRNIQKGFSLVEMLVSLSIFAIIMLASTGTLLKLIDVNAKAQALYTTTTNLSFALDSMTREMRMGYHYYCGNSDNTTSQTLPAVEDAVASNDYKDCNTPGSLISFVREKDDWQIGYRFNSSDGTIEQKINEPGVTGGGDTGWTKVTSLDEIEITTFSVSVVNSEPYCLNTNCTSTGDDNQPTAFLKVAGYVNNGLDTNTDFNIQTNIVQRRLDLK